MLFRKIISFFLYLFILSSFTTKNLLAQVCPCTTQQVLDNEVLPCLEIVGESINVSTPSEFQSAINQVNNSGGNMTILIEDGVYPVISTEWYPYITASNVVIRSLSGNRDDVILVGSGMASLAPETEIGIFAVGNNITITGLTIKDVGNHGIAATGENLFVHNVKIQDTYEQMVKGNSANGGPDFGIFQCSLLEYTAGVGPQWYIGGLDIHDGQDWIVSDNVFRNIASPSQQEAEHAVHFWDNSSNAIVERNKIYNCDRGIGFGLGSSASEGGIIRNNMIYNDGTGLFNDVGIAVESCPDTKIYNNTIYIDYQNAIEYRFESTTNVAITNNLCNRPITSRDGGTAILNTNVETVEASSFVDIATGDLHLAQQDPTVVDAGTDLGFDLPDDFDRNFRPPNAYDIGAHELNTTATISLDAFPIYLKTTPNPAQSVFQIQTNFQNKGRVLIYNSSGIVIFQSDVNQLLEIDCSNWLAGVYFCVLEDEDGNQIESNKIIRL